MPKGLFDHEKRVWLQMQSEKLYDLSVKFAEIYRKNGQHYFLSMSVALQYESEQCIKASKRKYIEYQPLLK